MAILESKTSGSIAWLGIVTHEMDFARAISDEVVFLDKGVIVERAAPEQFFTNPETERVKQFLKRYN